MLMAHACAFNGVPICTAYDSLGPDGLAHSLNETEVKGMFTNADLMGTLAKVIGNCKTVKTIVYDGEPDQKVLDELRGVREGLKLIHLDEVQKIGRGKMVEAKKVNRDDIYCCMYTSGSSESQQAEFSRAVLMEFSRYTQGCIAVAWQRHLCQ